MHLLVTGRPGVGKTTFTERIVRAMAERGVRFCGFLTREVREGGRRVGFEVVAVPSGARGTLARVDHPSDRNVGRYGVDVEDFERIAIPSLKARGVDFAVIDEIARMELCSDAFRTRVEALLRGDRPHVFATVQERSLGRLDGWGGRERCEVRTLLWENTEELHRRALKWIEDCRAR